jgi:putative ABC transport system permease protein
VIRLVFRDLVSNMPIWLGALVVTAAAGAAVSVAAGLVTSGFGLGFVYAVGLATLAFIATVLTIISIVAVLGNVTRLTVDLQRRSYALWQLVGVPAARVTWIVRTQLTVVAVLGSTLGTVIAAPFIPGILRFGLSDSSGLQEVEPQTQVGSQLVVVLFVSLVVVFGGLKASRRAGRVRAIEVLRDADGDATRMGIPRWILLGLTLALAVLMTWTVGNNSGGGSGQLLIIGPMFTAVGICAIPLVAPPLLRTWTRLIPDRTSTSWFLARNAAGFQVSRSTATISALVVTIALPGSFYAAFSTNGNFVRSSTGESMGTLGPGSFLILLGGPLLVSLAGAAATVLMATRTREQETALVQAAGGGRSLVLMRATWEALILVGTAALIAAGVQIVTGVGMALSLSRLAGTVPAFGLQPAVTAVAICVIVITAASAIPVASALRRPIRAVLASE